VPKLLDAYASDAKKHNRDVLFVVIGDQKTPRETAAYCAALAARSGLPVEYFSVERQEEYLSRHPELKEHLPYNSIQRRNVGMLFAYRAGCDPIITIDDDNFLVTDDYIGAHGIGAERSCEAVRTNTGWINVCSVLREAHGRTIYHRGFPLEKRTPEESWETERKSAAPVVNAGLWLGDPDVDALERLYHLADPTEAVALATDICIAPEIGTWTPFNSQNTALARKVIPAYFLSPAVGRYDDIWGSYILKHICDHLHDAITFGRPLVRQERNPHNYWRDLDNERYGHALTLRFVETLATIPLAGQEYMTCYADITNALPGAMSARTDVTSAEREFLDGYFHSMRVWRDTFAGL
jgi:hypothetical protein